MPHRSPTPLEPFRDRAHVKTEVNLRQRALELISGLQLDNGSQCRPAQFPTLELGPGAVEHDRVRDTCMPRGPEAQGETSGRMTHNDERAVGDTCRTDLADGILLCRHHHLLLHNNGWEIRHHDTTYWLTPPLDVDHLRTPIRMHSRSCAHTELLGKRTG